MASWWHLGLFGLGVFIVSEAAGKGPSCVREPFYPGLWANTLRNVLSLLVQEVIWPLSCTVLLFHLRLHVNALVRCSIRPYNLSKNTDWTINKCTVPVKLTAQFNHSFWWFFYVEDYKTIKQHILNYVVNKNVYIDILHSWKMPCFALMKALHIAFLALVLQLTFFKRSHLNVLFQHS